jgi:hypothetical protein
MRDDGIDNPTPLRVTINTPTLADVQTVRGRNSTYSPDALISSIRLPGASANAVDRACSLIDPALTRSMFIRLSCERVAAAVISHHQAYTEAQQSHTSVSTTDPDEEDEEQDDE